MKHSSLILILIFIALIAAGAVKESFEDEPKTFTQADMKESYEEGRFHMQLDAEQRDLGKFDSKDKFHWHGCFELAGE